MARATNFLQSLRALWLAVLMSLLASSTFAQEVGPKSTDSSEHRYNHLIGLQINELIRQIFNYQQSAAANPYMLTYELVSKKSQLGLRTGVGVGYNKQTLHGTNFDTIQTVLQADVRIGISKSFRIYRRFIAGVGVDMVFSYQKFENKQEEYQPLIHSSSLYDIDKTISTELWGAGPEISLKYQFSDRIAVGTELALHFLTGKQKNKTTYSYNANDNTEITTAINQLSLNSPSVFYIILRL